MKNLKQPKIVVPILDVLRLVTKENVHIVTPALVGWSSHMPENIVRVRLEKIPAVKP